MEFVKFDKEQKYRALIMDAETVAKAAPGWDGRCSDQSIWSKCAA
ncbi:MAG: hypothetical protein V8S14_06775 [Lachnospiraceae bacterium]